MNKIDQETFWKFLSIWFDVCLRCNVEGKKTNCRSCDISKLARQPFKTNAAFKEAEAIITKAVKELLRVNGCA